MPGRARYVRHTRWDDAGRTDRCATLGRLTAGPAGSHPRIHPRAADPPVLPRGVMSESRPQREVPPPRPPTATMILVVGLPAAGKTTRAVELAAAHRALRLTPDHWMVPLFGDPMADGRRFVLEGRLISVALQALRLGTSVVLDFGLWGRDERSALRWPARSTGASCRVVHLPVDEDVQLARIAHRQATAPHRTFPMTAADVERWREQFQVPDATELGDGDVPGPPAGWPGWPEWAADHWPSCADG